MQSWVQINFQRAFSVLYVFTNGFPFHSTHRSTTKPCPKNKPVVHESAQKKKPPIGHRKRGKVCPKSTNNTPKATRMTRNTTFHLKKVKGLAKLPCDKCLDILKAFTTHDMRSHNDTSYIGGTNFEEKHIQVHGLLIIKPRPTNSQSLTRSVSTHFSPSTLQIFAT